MVYTYKCEDGHVTEVKQSIKENTPEFVTCPVCGKKANRIWSDSSIIIPDHMKATSPTNRDYGGNPSYLKDRMRYMPSGKRKICY